MSENVEMTLINCLGLSRESPPHEVLGLLRLAGGSFVVPPLDTPDEESESGFERDGSSVAALTYKHAELAPDYYARDNSMLLMPAASPSSGKAIFSYLPKSSSVLLNQFIFKLDQSRINQVADGLYRVLRSLVAHLLPAYGYVDFMAGAKLVSRASRAVQRGEIHHLFWANVFGPALVHTLGESFFLGLPTGRVDRLPDQTILYRVTDSFSEWVNDPQEQVVTYFRERFPNITRFWPLPSDPL